MIIPAGVAHALLKDEGGFSMLGCYPVGGEKWDHCIEGKGGWGSAVEKRIIGLEWFTRDPIYGDRGPVLDAPGVV